MTQRLHILFLSGWFPSRVLPTNGDFVQRHAQAVATKHKVTLVHVITDKSIQGKPQVTKETIHGVKTIIVYVPRSNPVTKLIRFFRSYNTEINKIEPFDMVHLNITFPVGLIALFIKWFKRKPYIISEHWTGYQSPMNQTISFFRKKLTQLVVRNAAFVCPVSNDLGDAMQEFGLKGEYQRVPNIVDTKQFIISNIKKPVFTISHISHMGNDHKNVSGILRAIARVQKTIPELTFNLIGDNSKQYAAEIEHLNLKNIHVIDQIPNSEVADYLKTSNILVLFSNYENLPCIILESFSCGTPVISTNVGGVSEYFPDNFGVLIEPKDEQALHDAIIEIYHSQQNIDKDAMHNYAVSNFGVEAICKQFSNLYEQSLIKKS